jgi:hypothetical protein
MSKQTAVEWLGLELNIIFHDITPELWEEVELKFQQAKQMEKEQMIEFIKKAPIKTGLLREPDIYYIIDAESHYNETYGGQDEN